MKRLVFVLLSLLLIISLALTAFAESKRVYDYAGLFSDSDVTALETEIKELENHIGMDFVVLTTNSKDGKTLAAFADDFYDYDVSDRNSEGGLVMLIDMEERTVYVSTTGSAINYYTDKRIYNMTDGDDTLYEYLSYGDYKGAVERCISRIRDYYDEDNKVYTPSLNLFEILIALGLPALIGFFRINAIKKQYLMENEKKRASNYRLAYRAASSFAFAVSTDELIDRHITRTPIVIHSNGSSSSGGSTTHMGSSGTLHGGGGGGRHF